MNTNYTLADSSSVENTSIGKIFVEDAWVYQKSSKAANQNSQKPIRWVTDTRMASSLSTLFQVIEFGDSNHIAVSDHYLLVEKHKG